MYVASKVDSNALRSLVQPCCTAYCIRCNVPMTQAFSQALQISVPLGKRIQANVSKKGCQCWNSLVLWLGVHVVEMPALLSKRLQRCNTSHMATHCLSSKREREKRLLYTTYRSATNDPRLNIWLISETRRIKNNRLINILLRGSLKIFHYSSKRPRFGAKGCSCLWSSSRALATAAMRFQTWSKRPSELSRHCSLHWTVQWVPTSKPVLLGLVWGP